MQHAICKQGQFRYSQWRRRQVVTHDRDPFIYMSRKTHPDSKKMLVEEVLLWPHYDIHLVTEVMNSSAAKRTIVLRGRLFPLTLGDLTLLESVSKAAETKRARAAAVVKEKWLAFDDGARGNGSLTSRGSVMCPRASYDASMSISGGDDDDDCMSSITSEDDRSSMVAVQPPPASLNCGNPLVAAPRTTRSRLCQRMAVDDHDDGEDLGDFGNGEALGAHGAAGISRPTRKNRQWVFRCQTLDDLRRFVHALQGVDGYAASDPGANSPVPHSAFRGSFEEVEADIKRGKMHQRGSTALSAVP